MKGRIAIVLIALIGIGLYALPQTMALFAGQHSFTNIDPTGNQVDCVKCHGDVESELKGSVTASTNTSPPHADMECAFCHRLQIGESTGDNAYALITFANDTIVVAGNGKTTITGGTIKRNAVIPVGDYEAGNYPATINDNDVFGYNSSSRRITINGVDQASSFASISVSAAGATSAVLSSAGTALCGGSLINESNPSTGFKNQTICKGAGGKEYPLVVNGVPLDTNTSTQFTAFVSRLVTWNGTAPVFDNAGSRMVNKGSKYHAASLVACLDCHGGSSPSYAGHETNRLSEECALCHYGGETATAELGSNKMTNLEAGGFGMGLTNAATDTGSLEVHKDLMKADASAVSYVGGRYTPASNAGCIACHTHVDVDITYTRPNTLDFSADLSNGTWNVDGFAINTTNGTTITHG